MWAWLSLALWVWHKKDNFNAANYFTNDEMSVDEMSLDKMTCCHIE